MYQGVIIIIKADNRIDMYDINDALREAQNSLAFDILYPKPRYNKSLIKEIARLDVGRFQNFYYLTKNTFDTFKLVCPFFLIKREFLIEKHNNKDYGTGIIPLMKKLGYKFQNTEFSAVEKSSGRKTNQTITLSFKDTRGPAKKRPEVVYLDETNQLQSDRQFRFYKPYDRVYNEFKTKKRLFKKYMRLAENEKARYKNKSRKFTDNKTFTDPKEKARKELGIENPNPSRKEVLKAYKEKALKNHPDKGGDVEKMKRINNAKTTLLPNGLYKLKF